VVVVLEMMSFGVAGQQVGSGPLGLRPSPSSSALRLRPSSSAPALRHTGSTPQIFRASSCLTNVVPEHSAPPVAAHRGGLSSPCSMHKSAWCPPTPRRPALHRPRHSRSSSVLSPSRPSQPVAARACWYVSNLGVLTNEQNYKREACGAIDEDAVGERRRAFISQA
jgi:hypothetical protein